MCFAPGNVMDLRKWNWDGDVIVQQPIVPSGRKVVGVRSRRSYDIDVREYLTSCRNAVMERVVREKLPSYLRQHGGSVARFKVRKQGSFDYRAAVVTNFVADTISYQAGKGTAEREGLDFFLSREWTRLNPKFVGQVHYPLSKKRSAGFKKSLPAY